ncbi:MAG: hypothetical protein LBG69_03490, partial [Zoogloeaceae bacterium]|nr:hypothetical protein [Zoogloeaceae bacterium]
GDQRLGDGTDQQQAEKPDEKDENQDRQRNGEPQHRAVRDIDPLRDETPERQIQRESEPGRQQKDQASAGNAPLRKRTEATARESGKKHHAASPEKDAAIFFSGPSNN